MEDTEMTVYIFFRDIGWYPVELKDDQDAKAIAECNPGTLRVEDINGRVVWRMQ
ncbi:MAG TPA: hypothetical protein VM639_24560 [Dongiaceae bacterium]|nr:hypothetical protein [Dongiaceae bacterium]